MAIVATVWLAYEFWRLLWGWAAVWESSPSGAVDLKLRYREVHRWFAGMPTGVFGKYPPASYVLLWPLLGWPVFGLVRWLWVITTIGALIWLVYLVVKESGADTQGDCI